MYTCWTSSRSHDSSTGLALLPDFENVHHISTCNNYRSTKYFSAKLNVKKDVCPIYLKPRSVPFVTKEAIETEIKWLEAEGIIEKVPYSKWSAPIVSIDSVPIGNGKIRTCGDYKVTVNQSRQVDQYTLPKLEDLFASLAGGVKFSIIDLTQAYSSCS